LECGYRHIDCAYIYGNEGEIGEAIKKHLDAGLERKDLYVTSKLWNTKHESKDVRPSVMKSIKDLQVGYLDLYLIHWPIGLQSGENNFPKDDAGNLLYSEVDYLDSWAEMEKCVDEGLIKSIGLSNFNSEQVERVCSKARIQPAMLQVEVHPYLVQQELVKYCKEKGIAVTGYSPLGSKDRPWAKAGEPSLLEDPALIEVGKKYNKSPAQVCVRWQIQRGLVVIPKSSNPDRLKANSEVFDFELSNEDMEAVTAFNKPWRACLPKIMLADGTEVARDKDHPHFPFGIPF